MFLSLKDLESKNLPPPQAGDIFPSKSGSSNPHSRVIFPSGWNEPVSRGGMIRIPSNPHRNVHQTESASMQEYRDRNMPKIVNCTTVGPRNQQRRYVISNCLESTGQSEQSGFVTPTYEIGQVDAEVIHEGQFRQQQQQQQQQHQQRGLRRGAYVVSSSSPVIQEVFSRPAGSRSHEMHARSHSHGSRSSEGTYQQNSPNSAFVPFGTHQQVRHHYPSYQEMRSVRNNQQTNQANTGHQSSDHLSRSRFNCPIPIPNQGTVVMNPNQPVMLPPYGSHDGLSGILVIPLKKTCEIAVQTDESCMSSNYAQYVPPSSNKQYGDAQQANGTEGSTHAQCSVCQKEFKDSQKLRQHYDAVHSKESLRCKDCGQIFLTARNMQMHKVRVHNKRMPFRCGVCGVRFEDRASVVQHLSTHNANEYIFRCDACGKRFGSEEKLRKHEQKHEDMWHKCADCNKSFGSEVTLAYHIEQVHQRTHDRLESDSSNNDKQNEPHGPGTQVDAGESRSQDPQMNSYGKEAVSTGETPTDGDGVSCEFCSAKFYNDNELDAHVKNCGLGRNMKKMFRCAVCQTFFALKSQLVNHYNTIHLTRDGYLCSKCPRKFRLWSRLKLHIKAFHQTKKSVPTKNVCSVCSEKFMSRNKLEDHLRQVHQIQPFQSKVGRIYTCKECKKRFTNLSSLMVHRRGVHSLNILESPSTQTWKCQYCSIERLTKKTYIAHLKEVHSLSVIEKGRSLEIVGRTTEDSSQTQNNGEFSKPPASNPASDVRLAEAEKQTSTDELSCKECGAHFSDKKRLMNHLGLVHEQKPFSCDVCNKRFAYSGQVTWHMREHNSQTDDVTSSQATSTDSTSTSAAVSKGSDVIVTSESDGGISVEQVIPPHTCIHCNTTYPNEKQLNNHLGMRHGYKNFECDICNQRFSYSTHLIWHRRSHFPEKKKDNNTKASDEENLNSDQALEDSVKDDHAGGPELQYDESKGGDDDVDSQGDDAMGEKNNSVTYRQATRFVCGQCGASFTGQEEFKEHMAEVHNVGGEKLDEGALVGGNEVQGIGSYVCEICNKQLSTQIGWKVHRTRVHKLTDDKSVLKSPVNSSQELFEYPPGNGECDEIYENDDDILEGIDEERSQSPKKNELGSEDLSPNAVYSCTKCSRVFTGLRSLRTHQFKLHAIRVKDSHHRPLQTSDDANLFSRVQGSEIYQCGTCDYRFSSEKGRRIHCKKMRHAEQRGPYNLTDSVMDADELESPTVPKRQKLSSDDFNTEPDDISLCEICDAEFLGLKELKLHFQEKHPEELFYQEPGLKSHDLQGEVAVSTPAQANPPLIACPRCDRSFSSRKAINAHMVKYHKIKGAALVRTLKEGRTVPQDPSFMDVPDNQDLSLGSSDLADFAVGESKGFKVCPVCQRAFHNRRGLTMHLVRYHHMNKIGIQKFNLGAQYDDEIPATSSISKKAGLSDHHSTGLKEHCPLCPMNFPSKRSLGTHIFKRHGIRCKQLSPAERRSLFSGTIYPRTDGNTTASNREILVATDCPICGGKFVGKRGLRAHVSRIHGLDKIELGFMFPDKNVTDDESLTKCKECDRVFNNKRIFAAHLYFVHKRDKMDMNTEEQQDTSQSGVSKEFKEQDEKEEAMIDKKTTSETEGTVQHGTFGEGAMEEPIVTIIEPSGESEGKYFCTDSNCNEMFENPLELLVHVREKNGRSLKDVDKEVKNANHDVAVEENDESFNYDFIDDDDDEVDLEDDVLDAEEVMDGESILITVVG